MSNRELAKSLIDQISDAKLLYVIETPNRETLEAMAEVQAMIETDAGEHFDGSTSDFLAMLSEE